MINQPNNIDAEIVVLGSCLSSVDGSVYDELSQILQPDDFFKTSHKVIFAAMGRVATGGDELSELSVAEAVRTDGDEGHTGGVAELFGITSRVDTSLQGKWAAKQVLEKSKRRKIIRHCREGIELAEEDVTDSSEIGAQLESSIQSIQDVVTVNDGSIRHAAADIRDDIKAMINGTYEIKSMPTYIKQLDDKLAAGGVCGGEVMVIAAPTSCGKTQIALNVVLANSLTHNKPGLYFSFEMQAKSLANRLVQTASGCNLKQARDGVMNTGDQKKVATAIDRLEAAPIFTDHYVRSVEEMRSKARMFKRKHSIEWLVVDYLQLVPYDKRLKKHDGIAQVSHDIKLMAMELDIPVFLLAQVNREGAKRDTGLTLYDLKDSGDIENDADIILLMWPDGKDVDEAKKIDTDGSPYVSLCYNVAKQREGERDQKGIFKFKNHVGLFV